METCFQESDVKGALEKELEYVQQTLGWLADQILSTGIPPILRRKYENEITEMVHQRFISPPFQFLSVQLLTLSQRCRS